MQQITFIDILFEVVGVTLCAIVGIMVIICIVGTLHYMKKGVQQPMNNDEYDYGHNVNHRDSEDWI